MSMQPRTLFTAVFLAVLCLGTALSGCAGKRSTSPDQDAARAHALVTSAHQTLQSQLDGNRGEDLRKLLSMADGVMIVPDMGSAGFLFSLDTGSGVLLARNGKNWAGPVFLTEASGGFGMLAGFRHVSGVFIYTDVEDVRYVLESGGIFQGRGGITVFSSNLDFKSTPKFQESGNVFFIGDTTGLYAGTGVHGGGLMTRDHLNKAYYGFGDGDPEVILFKGFPAPEDGIALRALLAGAIDRAVGDEKGDGTEVPSP